ncbi:hypothetical protein OG216_37760 [Streptomycetaceae bacterium NBC_01309]
MPCVSEGLRLLRAGVFAGVCVALSVGGHVLASGGAVPVRAVLGAVLAALGLSWLGAGRERSARGLVAAMGAGQLGLHTWFSWAAERAAETTAHRHGSGPGHVHGGGPHEALVAPGGAGMLAAHLAVAAAAALWLRVGEAAVFRLLARWDARVRAGVRVLLGPRPAPGRVAPRVRAVAGRPGVLRGLPTRYDVARRGPPAAAYSR